MCVVPVCKEQIPRPLRLYTYSSRRSFASTCEKKGFNYYNLTGEGDGRRKWRGTYVFSPKQSRV